MRRFIAVPLLLTALLASACGGGADTAASPSSAPAPVSSPPSPSSSPAPESAKDFIRRWFHELDVYEATGDRTQLAALHRPDCGSCKSVESLVDKIYAAGGAIQAQPVTLLSIERKADSRYYVKEQSKPSRYRLSATAPWKHLSGGIDTQVYDVVKSGNSWLVANFAQVAGTAR